MACERCRYPSTLYASTEPLGNRSDGWMFLIRCPDCETFYELCPIARRRPEELSVERVRELYPERLSTVRSLWCEDGRVSLRFQGVALAARPFHKDGYVTQGAIVENKLLSGALARVRGNVRARTLPRHGGSLG